MHACNYLFNSQFYNNFKNQFEPIYNQASNALKNTALKIKICFQNFILGFSIGMVLPPFIVVLAKFTIRLLRISENDSPFSYTQITLKEKLRLAPDICLIGPIVEEVLFRGIVQSGIKKIFIFSCRRLGCAETKAAKVSRITTLFLTSTLFGVSHLSNARAFRCHPSVFLPQVIGSCFYGLIFGLAKEWSGGLAMPIGMHVGNNSLVWSANILVSLNEH
ncbi:MAG: hypothetical protein Tsb0021_12290 [Chlamydiales bacterium]